MWDVVGKGFGRVLFLPIPHSFPDQPGDRGLIK